MTAINNILVVDDIQSNRILLDKILSDEGYQVISVANGEDAINYVNENEVDLILLDIMMPNKDGFTVFKELKSKEKTASIPVIFITVINNDADTLRAFEMGAVDYITKPFTPTELRIRIRTQIALVNARKLGHENLPNVQVEKDDLDSLITDMNEQLHSFKNKLNLLQSREINKIEQERLKALNSELDEIKQLFKNLRK